MALVTHPLSGHRSAARPPRVERQPSPTAYGMPLSRLARRATGALASLVLGVALLAFLGLGVGPHVFGYRTVTMLTGSMSPMINPGDVVIAVPKPASEIAVGDVLTYAIPVEDHRVETHRVVEVSRTPAGEPVIVTKGDANNGVDPWKAVVEGETVYETEAVVPHLGSAIRVLRDPTLHAILLWGAAAALVLLGLWQIWSPGRGQGDESAS